VPGWALLPVIAKTGNGDLEEALKYHIKQTPLPASSTAIQKKGEQAQTNQLPRHVNPNVGMIELGASFQRYDG
jgi:hypothetical protein